MFSQCSYLLSIGEKLHLKAKLVSRTSLQVVLGLYCLSLILHFLNFEKSRDVMRRLEMKGAGRESSLINSLQMNLIGYSRQVVI